MGIARIAIFFLVCSSLLLLILASACGGEENPFGVKSEIVTAAELPVALAFAPDGRLFYAEQATGNIRIVTPAGELQPEPFAQVNVIFGLEWGLTGLALDPDFETNHYVYAFYTEAVDPDGPIARPVVIRLTEVANSGVDPQVIVEDLPDTDPETPHFQASGSIHFGPDGFLYLTLGDYDLDLSRATQDLSSAIGKMLRINKDDGSAPPDNPFADQPDTDPRIFAYGFRENFDFAFHPQTGEIYGSDNTTVSCEELNLITKGGNYDWPEVGEFPYGDCSVGRQTQALHLFAKGGMEPEDFLSLPFVTGKEFVSGDVYPLLGDSLLVCESETKLIRRLVLNGANLDQVLSDDLVVEDCTLDIAVSPDGIIYYSNSGEIRRLVPQVQETPSS